MFVITVTRFTVVFNLTVMSYFICVMILLLYDTELYKSLYLLQKTLQISLLPIALSTVLGSFLLLIFTFFNLVPAIIAQHILNNIISF